MAPGILAQVLEPLFTTGRESRDGSYKADRRAGCASYAACGG